jgi:hypothetical protein
MRGNGKARPRLIERAVLRPEAEAKLLSGHREERRRQLEAARLYAELEASGHYLLRGASSIAHFGELHGRSGREARMLASVGRMLELCPAVEEKLLSGALSMDTVAALRPLYEKPSLVREGEDWLAWAEVQSARRVEREVRRRIREEESGEQVTTLTALLTESGWEKFERARVLAGRKARAQLSRGKAVEALADHFLKCFDPDRRPPRKRRMPDTEGHPGRAIAESAKRAIRSRPHGDCCAVPGCDHHLFLNYAHVRPHRYGGGREPKDLHYLCWPHHVLFDAGILKITGTPDRPTFHLPDGRVLLGCAPVDGPGLPQEEPSPSSAPP